MTTIGVLGASGQVGTEVCLFLKTYSDVQPVAIVRTPVSGALLKRLGVETRVGTLRDPNAARELLQDCDVIADFSRSAGSTSEIDAHYRENIARALECSPQHAKYVFVSTINAFGQGPGFSNAKRYLIAHSVYGATKRYAERLVTRCGRRYRKPTYVFRLGHVHGELQRVSEEARQLILGGYRRFAYPDTPSYTVFCHTIAEALINVANDRENPGTYTVISSPPWSWKEVLEYHADRPDDIEVELYPVRQDGVLGRSVSRLRNLALSFLLTYRETMRANVLCYFPRAERRLAAAFYVRRARQQIERFNRPAIFRPDDIHTGIFPGRRLSGLTDSRRTMDTRSRQVRQMLEPLSRSPGLP